MKTVVISKSNGTPHVLAYCHCGWDGSFSQDTKLARRELFKHMRKNKCKSGSIEVGRISQYTTVLSN